MAEIKKSKFEYTIFTCIIFLIVLGLLVLYSASSVYASRTYGSSTYLFIRQGIFCAAGIFIVLFLSFIHYKVYMGFSNYIFIGSLILVIITAFAGRISRGSSRWIELRGLIFQPSELMKLAVILYLSKLLTANIGRLEEKDKFLKVMIVAYLPTFIVALSNLSTGIIIFIIATFMIFVVSKKKMIFIYILAIFVLFYIFAFPVAKVFNDVGILKGYQVGRIFAWKEPDNYPDISYQTVQGLAAIGSGKITGRGYLNSIQKYLLPEAQNDMIFCVLCEELGLIGAGLFILLYVILIFRIFYIAYKQEYLDTMLLTFGIGVHLALQVLLNIGVVTNLLPNTGVTLPFVSYGGSSLIVTSIEMGIVMSISRYTEVR